MFVDKDIKNKIRELFESTPEYVGVIFGKKNVKGKYIDEDCIIFTVEVKKPLDEIPEEERLPSSVEINGKIYRTDVREVGKTELLICHCETVATLSECEYCPSSVLNNCYKWMGYPVTDIPENRGYIRPLKGGVKIAPHNGITESTYGWGTLGFIAVDNITGALVGVTNNHVVVSNAFYTSYRHPNDIIQNELDNPVYQPYIDEINGQTYPHDYDVIGKVLRYVPFTVTDYNYADAAILSVSKSVIDIKESFKQFDLPYNYPMEFATEAEIDGLTSSTPIYSSGARTGAKIWGTVCSLKYLSASDVFSVTYSNGSYLTPVYFEDAIVIERYTVNCPCPITRGDSGSALIANFAGIWKIIGLIFAANNMFGYACKITDVVSLLNISAWDGTDKPEVNLNSQERITISSQSALKTLDCPAGKTYWQVGNTNTSEPCSA